MGALHVPEVAHLQRAVGTCGDVAKDVAEQLTIPVTLLTFEYSQDLAGIYKPAANDLGQERRQLVCPQLRTEVDHGLRCPGSARITESGSLCPDEAEPRISPGGRLAGPGEDRDLGGRLLLEPM